MLTDTTPATVLQAPALPGDAEIVLTKNGKIERRIVWNLLAQLAAAGFAPVSVYDGAEEVETADAVAAMEAVFAGGVVHLRVRKEGQGPRWIKLVPGNGEDILSDWGYSRVDGVDPFDALMESFKPGDAW